MKTKSLTPKEIMERFELIAGTVPSQFRREETTKTLLESNMVDGLTHEQYLLKTPDGDTVTCSVVYAEKNDFPKVALCFHRSMDEKGIGRLEPVGILGNKELHYGKHLAMRGFFSISLDYPGFGKYHPDVYELGWESVTRKNIFNYECALHAFIGNNCNTSKIVAIGHSMGGSNAIFYSAMNPVSAIAVSCGFTSFGAFAKTIGQGNLDRWALKDKYMPLIKSKFDSEPGKIPVDFHELLFCSSASPIFLNCSKTDTVFDYAGAMECVNLVQAQCDLLGIKHEIVIKSPDAGHSFPEDIETAACDFLARI